MYQMLPKVESRPQNENVGSDAVERFRLRFFR